MRNRNPRSLRRLAGSAVAGAVMLIGGLGAAHAQQVPTVLPYQGYLSNSDGQALNESVDLTFRMYASPNSDSPVWSETVEGVFVEDGIFYLYLGMNSPLSNYFTDGSTRYLGVEVNGDGEALPRQEIGSVPYAMLAGDAMRLGGYPADSFVTEDDVTVILESDNYITQTSLEQYLSEQEFVTVVNVEQILEGDFVTQEEFDQAIANVAVDVEQVTNIVNQELGDRGYVTEARVNEILTARGYQSAAQVNALIDARGYVTADAVSDLINARGYVTEVRVNQLIDARGYVTTNQVNNLIDARGYATVVEVNNLANTVLQDVLNELQAQIDDRVGDLVDNAVATAVADTVDALVADAIADQVGALQNAVNNNANNIAGNAGDIQANFELIGDNADAISALQAQVATLTARVTTLENNGAAAAEPTILGVSNQTSDGRFSFNGQTGISAAREMCIASYGAGAHMCTSHEASLALAAGNYNDNVNNVATWTVSNSELTNRNGGTGSLSNTCQNLSYNTGDLGRGTKMTVKLNAGASVAANVIQIESNQGCGTAAPVLCCR